MRLTIDRAGGAPPIYLRRSGSKLGVAQGAHKATLPFKNAGTCRDIVAGLQLHAKARPRADLGELLEVAFREQQAAENFRRHRRRIPQFTGGI